MQRIKKQAMLVDSFSFIRIIRLWMFYIKENVGYTFLQQGLALSLQDLPFQSMMMLVVLFASAETCFL